MKTSKFGGRNVRTVLAAVLTLVAPVALAAPVAPSPSVRVSEVREMQLSEPVVVGGHIRARSDIILPATLDGEMTWVAEEGSRVLAGAVVAKIDDEQLLLNRREQVLMAERAAISVDYLSGEVDRLNALLETNLASRTQLAELVSRRDLAANDLQVARARIAQIDEQLARTKIKSPVDAMVVERRIAGGEYARRGDGVLRLVDPTNLEIEITIPLNWLGRISGESPVRVVAGEVEFDAEVRALITAGSASSQTFTALANVPGEFAPMLISGQMVEVSVPLSLSRVSLFVPRDAVVLRSAGNYVYRIDDNNVATRISVALGEGQGEMVSVTGDLSKGDRIAVRGVERLSDGQTVTPTQT